MSTTNIQCWQLEAVGEPLVRERREARPLAADEVLVRVAGCGVCHTDLGFAVSGVRTRHPLPLTLGHEIAGVVEQAGADASALVGRSVVVPAVIPCGACALCARGQGMACRRQIFPGCDVHGGFASHVVVPARGLCPVDTEKLAASGIELADLSVLGDAVSTAYQSIVRTDLRAGDLAVVVGAGGVGGFCAQLARALGAVVVACDVDDQRLAALTEHGVHHVVNVRDRSPKQVRAAVKDFAQAEGLPLECWRIYECSGTAAGQATAYGLLTFGAALGVVGYTMDTIELRLSNLMAFDAAAVGNWGCLPEHYPAVLDLVLSGAVAVKPFVEHHPMSAINQVFDDLHHHRLTRRPVLLPDF